MTTQAKRFSRRELIAIEEALASRLAGEIDIADEPMAPRREDYEAALDRVAERLDRGGVMTLPAMTKARPGHGIEAGLLPGERRMSDGKVWCFNLDMRIDFIACRAMWQCLWHPPVLAELTEPELHELETHTFRFDCWAQRVRRVFGWPTEQFRIALNDERARREAQSQPQTEAA